MSKQIIVDLTTVTKKNSKRIHGKKKELVEGEKGKEKGKEKEKKKRVITNEESKWGFLSDDLTVEKQLCYIQELNDDKGTNANTNNDKPCQTILHQLRQKIAGYKAQDQEKALFVKDKFVDLANVLDLLNRCNNQCFYCKEPVQVLYEYVREPKQWSLERIDNQFGHNKDNVVIACLTCNLRRKTMYHERYLFTKEMRIFKTDNADF